MREPDFKQLATRLLKRGITRRHAHRTVNELRDHYDDLIDAAVNEGADGDGARRKAAAQLGTMDDFLAEMRSRRELKSWAFRYPRVALLIYPLACLAVLPAMPVLVGVAHASTLARWGASLLAAGFVTASLLLAMQLSILLG